LLLRITNLKALNDLLIQINLLPDLITSNNNISSSQKTFQPKKERIVIPPASSTRLTIFSPFADCNANTHKQKQIKNKKLFDTKAAAASNLLFKIIAIRAFHKQRE